jgi:hypothetical protein
VISFPRALKVRQNATSNSFKYLRGSTARVLPDPLSRRFTSGSMINFPRALKARQNATWNSFNDKYLRAVPPRGFFLIHSPDVSRLDQ